MTESLHDAARAAALLVFDLDNTLIDENTWLAAAYGQIARLASPADPATARDIAAALLTGFLSDGRTGLFERVRTCFPAAAGDNAAWLAAMRSAEVPNGLPVAPWAQDLCALFPDKPLAVLTNGNAAQQRNKFRQILPSTLRDRFHLFCSADYEPKPSPAGLIAILSEFQCPPAAALFIGDTDTDRLCSERAGVPFLMVPDF